MYVHYLPARSIADAISFSICSRLASLCVCVPATAIVNSYDSDWARAANIETIIMTLFSYTTNLYSEDHLKPNYTQPRYRFNNNEAVLCDNDIINKEPYVTSAMIWY